MGDSDVLDVGDELNIFGYPGIGGDTVTFTARRGQRLYSATRAVEGRAWIKTDATIAGGNSGGTAVDEIGRLVGVPTEMGAGDADLRRLPQSGGHQPDGKLDDKDTCVPVGGFINALRPAKLALPLIEAARQGLTYQGRGSQPSSAPAPTGQPRLSNLQFASGVTEFDQPTHLVSSLPSGSRNLYLFFDYENMTDGASWEVRVELNGKQLAATGMASQPWRGGPAGNWWVGWSDADFVDGAYKFQVLVGGKKLAEAAIQVGGRAPDGAQFQQHHLQRRLGHGWRPNRAQPPVSRRYRAPVLVLRL